MNKDLIDTLVNVILIGIPECIALTMLVLAFLQLPLIWKKIITVAITQTIIVLSFRFASSGLELPGLHTTAAIVALGLLVSFFWRVPKLKSLTCSVIAIIFLVALEMLYYNLFQMFLAETIEQIAQSEIYWVLSSWLDTLTIIFAAVLIMKSQWYQKGLHKNTPFNNSRAR